MGGGSIATRGRTVTPPPHCQHSPWPTEEAVPLSLSHLLSCTKEGHCNGRHNDVRDEISKMCRTAGMQVSRECLLPEVRRVVNGSASPGSRNSARTFGPLTTKETVNTTTWQSHTQRGKKVTTKKVLSAANRRELQKLSKYGCNERSYKSDDIHLLP